MSYTRTDINQLLRNIMILPVLRSSFERDRQLFLADKYMVPYAITAERVLQRINDDVRKLYSTLQTIGIQLINEEQDSSKITVLFDYRCRQHSYKLQWGTFDGEIELLQHYYLGNLDSSMNTAQGGIR